MNILPHLEELWTGIGGDRTALDRMELPSGPDVLPSSFLIDDVAQGTIALTALAASECLRIRGGPVSSATADRFHAAVEFKSDRFYTIDGVLVRDLWDPLAGLYKCKDGWVRIHTNFPHHRSGFLELLRCEPNRPAVAAVLLDWEATALEDEAAAHGLPATALRSYEEWSHHPQYFALENEPPVHLQRVNVDTIGFTTKFPIWTPTDPRPLSKVRVLDLTRIIAGPVAGRTLVAHGADVLHISASHLPSIDELVLDTGRGKRTTVLDLRQSSDHAVFCELIKGADVLLQGYRPGGLAELGFDFDSLQKLRPGLVVADLCAYGFSGPWSMRRGFDSLTQTATGYNTDEMEAFGDLTPRPLPTQALDHCSGYLLALGIMSALNQRHIYGGGYHVKVSLAGTGRWVRGLGRCSPTDKTFLNPKFEDIMNLCEELPCWKGTFCGLKHSGIVQCCPPCWAEGAHALGHHPPEWW